LQQSSTLGLTSSSEGDIHMMIFGTEMRSIGRAELRYGRAVRRLPIRAGGWIGGELQ